MDINCEAPFNPQINILNIINQKSGIYMKFSEEAYSKIMELLQAEYDLQSGHEDRQEEISTIIS